MGKKSLVIPDGIMSHIHHLNGWTQDRFSYFLSENQKNYADVGSLIHDFCNYMQQIINDEYTNYPVTGIDYKNELMKEIDDLKKLVD